MPSRPPPPSCTTESEVSTAWRRDRPFSIITMRPAASVSTSASPARSMSQGYDRSSATTSTDQFRVVVPAVGPVRPGPCAGAAGTARTAAREATAAARDKRITSAFPPRSKQGRAGLRLLTRRAVGGRFHGAFLNSTLAIQAA